MPRWWPRQSLLSLRRLKRLFKGVFERILKEIYNIISHYIIPCYVLFYSILLYCIILYYHILSYNILYCIVLYCIVLHCIALHCIALYCIVLYCIVLHCIICQSAFKEFEGVSFLEAEVEKVRKMREEFQGASAECLERHSFCALTLMRYRILSQVALAGITSQEAFFSRPFLTSYAT